MHAPIPTYQACSYTIIISNFHLDNKHDLDTKHFISCLQSFGLRQHVGLNTAIHKNGPTLDVVITRASSNLVSELTVSDPIKGVNPGGWGPGEYHVFYPPPPKF